MVAAAARRESDDLAEPWEYVWSDTGRGWALGVIVWRSLRAWLINPFLLVVDIGVSTECTMTTHSLMPSTWRPHTHSHRVCRAIYSRTHSLTDTTHNLRTPAAEQTGRQTDSAGWLAELSGRCWMVGWFELQMEPLLK